MSGIVSEQDRLDFVESVAQADSDSRTTGLFLAPRKDGYIRETVLTVGNLPTGAIMRHLIQQSRVKFRGHNTWRPQ